MKRNIIIELFLVLILLLSFVNSVFADKIIDKRGRVIEETLSPVPETTVDPNAMSDALRRSATNGNHEVRDASKNIYDVSIIRQDVSTTIVNEEYTSIRHTASITDLNKETYYITEDLNKERIRLTIKTLLGEVKAKDGFYKVGDKVYYFDSEGLMVLGPAYDDIGNYYFFSYETGELLEEIQVR